MHCKTKKMNSQPPICSVLILCVIGCSGSQGLPKSYEGEDETGDTNGGDADADGDTDTESDNSSDGCHLKIPDGPPVPADRRIDWQPGIPCGIPDYPVQHSVLDFGAVADGHTPNKTDNRDAFQKAIDATRPGQALLVPAGRYYLSTGVMIRKGIVVRGEGSDKTTVESDGEGILFDVKNDHWNASLNYTNITAGGDKGSNTITVSDVSSFRVGDYVQMSNLDDIVEPDGRTRRNWPTQHTEVESINRNTLTFNTDLYSSFTSVAKVDLLTGAGIEKIHIKGISGNKLFTKTRFIRCAHCWLRDCETSGAFRDMVQTEIYTILLSDCYRSEIRGNYFHHTQEEADSGRDLGYGIIVNGSTDILVVNNALDFFSPAIVHAYGSGGGVIAYNFVWQSIKAGNYNHHYDIEGHNFNDPYQWLIEGNNHAHYRNQNFLPMTILRDKTVMAGIYFEGTIGANIIGNQLDKTKWESSHNFITPSEDAIVHGNYTVENRIGLEWDPDIPDHNIPNSYYLPKKPAWFGDFKWPPYGGDLMKAGGGNNPNRIPAEVRYWNTRFPENAPTDLSVVKVNETTRKLTWTSKSLPKGQVDKIDFIVVRSTDGKNFERFAATEQTSYTDTDLTPGQQYWYYVRARNHMTIDIAGGEHVWSGPGGESPPSNIVAPQNK